MALAITRKRNVDKLRLPSLELRSIRAWGAKPPKKLFLFLFSLFYNLEHYLIRIINSTYIPERKHDIL